MVGLIQCSSNGGTSTAESTATPPASNQVVAPVYSPSAGTYNTNQNVTITSTTAGAVICYTDDGSTTPACNATKDACSAGTKYTSAIAVSGDGTSKSFKALACKSGMDDSMVATATISINLSDPGSLDTSFDTDGIVTTAIGTYGYGAGAFATAIQSNGKIVVAGESHNGTNLDIALVRYNADGSLDTNFDSDGIVTTAFDLGGSKDDQARAIVILGDGKIVIVAEIDNTSNDDFGLVRYNADGSIDTTFGTDGKVTTDIASRSDVAEDMAIQSDGRIVVVGESSNGTNNDVALARYWP